MYICVYKYKKFIKSISSSFVVFLIIHPLSFLSMFRMYVFLSILPFSVYISPIIEGTWSHSTENPTKCTTLRMGLFVSVLRPIDSEVI